MDNKQTENTQKDLKKKQDSDLFGIPYGESLQSVNFATTENRYLNERSEEDDDE